MPTLTDNQVALLRRARDGQPVWGGVVPLSELQAEVDVLRGLRLLEPVGTGRFRLTALGHAVLERCRHDAGAP